MVQLAQSAISLRGQRVRILIKETKLIGRYSVPGSSTERERFGLTCRHDSDLLLLLCRVLGLDVLVYLSTK
jgi:hypothetical protein